MVWRNILKPIAIICPGRCGSTLLQRSLDQHPQLNSIEEPFDSRHYNNSKRNKYLSK